MAYKFDPDCGCCQGCTSCSFDTTGTKIARVTLAGFTADDCSDHDTVNGVHDVPWNAGGSSDPNDCQWYDSSISGTLDKICEVPGEFSDWSITVSIGYDAAPSFRTTTILCQLLLPNRPVPIFSGDLTSFINFQLRMQPGGENAELLTNGHISCQNGDGWDLPLIEPPPNPGPNFETFGFESATCHVVLIDGGGGGMSLASGDPIPDCIFRDPTGESVECKLCGRGGKMVELFRCLSPHVEQDFCTAKRVESGSRFAACLGCRHARGSL